MAILSRSSSQKHGRSGSNGPRFLVTVTVRGSAGPIRFVACEGDTVANVITAALRSYARQGRRPSLSSDPGDFLLYHANGGFDVLIPSQIISSSDNRAFVLCRKQQAMVPQTHQSASPIAGAVPLTGRTPLQRKANGGVLKSWFSNLRISSRATPVVVSSAP